MKVENFKGREEKEKESSITYLKNISLLRCHRGEHEKKNCVVVSELGNRKNIFL